MSAYDMHASDFQVQDLPTINEWLRQQNIPTLQFDHLPAIGVWVPGAAAGWAFRVETGRLAILDLFVGCPDADAATKRAGLEAVALGLFTRLKQRGVRHAIATARHPTILQAAEAVGMRNVGNASVLVKEI